MSEQRCIQCGSPLPDNQGSRTCSMCYGDIDHGHDGYYRQWAEHEQRDRDESADANGELGLPEDEDWGAK